MTHTKALEGEDVAMNETGKLETKPHMTAAAIATHAFKGLFSDYNSQLEWLTIAIKDYSATQLAERDAQLAAAKRTITKLQNGYAAATEWALASVDGPSKQMPKYEVDRLKKIATDMVHNCAVWRIKPHEGNTRLVAALQAARQPTQDKGGE